MPNFISRLFGASPQGCVVQVHLTGPDGDSVVEMTVGSDIPLDVYERAARASVNGELYGLAYYEQGIPKRQIVPKFIWEQARAAHQEIDEAGGGGGTTTS